MDVKNEKAIADIFVKITHETSSNWDIRMLPEKKLKKSKQDIHKLSTDNWCWCSLWLLPNGFICTQLAFAWFMAENFSGVKLPEGRLILFGEDRVCVTSIKTIGVIKI